ncbi:MAG: hypothetical protein Q8S02_12500 [Hydrogenophaga sp.]|nr:hypothetical protein [Hydrogenophaga sp.]
MSTVVSPAPASLGLRANASGADTVAQTPRHRSEGARGLAALLLAAVVAALVVVADQVIDSWADGHVFLAWVLLWAVVFAATMVFAGTARRTGLRAMAVLNRWSRAAAERRAEARMWEIAKTDPRVMSELVAAQQRTDVDEAVAAVPDSEALMRLARSQMPAGRRRAVFYC